MHWSEISGLVVTCDAAWLDFQRLMHLQFLSQVSRVMKEERTPACCLFTYCKLHWTFVVSSSQSVIGLSSGGVGCLSCPSVLPDEGLNTKMHFSISLSLLKRPFAGVFCSLNLSLQWLKALKVTLWPVWTNLHGENSLRANTPDPASLPVCHMSTSIITRSACRISVSPSAPHGVKVHLKRHFKSILPPFGDFRHKQDVQAGLNIGSNLIGPLESGPAHNNHMEYAVRGWC